jgi:hypothetical protein
MYQPGDRVQRYQRRGTLLFVKYDTALKKYTSAPLSGDGPVTTKMEATVTVRDRSGIQSSIPPSWICRSPLVKGRFGGLRYEYEPETPVLFLHPNQGFHAEDILIEGVIEGYLSEKEMNAAQQGRVGGGDQDRVWVLDAEGGRHSVSVTRLIVDEEKVRWGRPPRTKPKPEGDGPHPRGCAEVDYSNPDHIKNRVAREDLLEELAPTLDWANLDWNGHKKSGAAWADGCYFDTLEKRIAEVSTLSLSYGGGFPTPEEVSRLRAAFDAGTVLPDGEWIPIGSPSKTFWMRCSYCGCSEYGDWNYFETNGKQVRQAGPRCTQPQGFPKTKVRLSLPTGRLLYADDVRELLPMRGTPDINSTKGQVKFDQMHAKAGAAHGFVGNSCPGIYRMPDNTYAVANWPWDDEADEPDTPKGVERVGSICTDVWSATLMSAELAVARADALGLKYKKTELARSLGADGILELDPGTYEFTIDAEARRNEGTSDPEMYITFKRVGDATEIDDSYLRQWDGVEFTAHQQIAQNIKSWPTLFGQGTLESNIVSAADHMMLTIGSGGEWHKDGFISTLDMDADITPIEAIPQFQGLYHWYPFSAGYSGLMLATGLKGYGQKRNTPLNRALNLNKSYQELAYRILQNIISYGYPARQEHWTKELADPIRATNGNFVGVIHNQQELNARQDVLARERVLLAAEAFRRLVRRWPESFSGVDPRFTAWMKKTKQVNAWIKSLQLTFYNPAKPLWVEDPEGLGGWSCVRPPYPTGLQGYIPQLARGLDMRREGKEAAAEERRVEKARIRFSIQAKLESGEELTPEEQQAKENQDMLTKLLGEMG